MTAAWNNELALLGACCRWPPSPERQTAVQRAASRPIDWDRFVRSAKRHRVAALAADGLQHSGLEVPAAIAADAVATATRGLRLAREAIGLQRAFDAAGTSAFFVKGSALAQLAYGDLGKKHSWDIDLVTTPGEAVRARGLLQEAGYELTHPVLNDAQFARYAAFEKESTFSSTARSVSVDLHWRLSDNEALLAGIGADARTQEVRLGAGVVRTLADEPLFAYLCVHGTVHGWARLKWLADVAAFLSRWPEAEVSRFHDVAVGLGAGRTPGVALLLCHRLLGLKVEPRLLETLQNDVAIEALAATSLNCLTHGGGTSEIGKYTSTGLRLSLSHFSLVPGRRYAWGQLNRLFTSGWDRARISLPKHLQFLYYLLRIPSFVVRLAARQHR